MPLPEGEELSTLDEWRRCFYNKNALGVTPWERPQSVVRVGYIWEDFATDGGVTIWNN